jgi:anti-anti-sigma regulatory factor
MNVVMDESGTTVFAAEGDLGIYKAIEFKGALADAIAASDRVELDFRGASSIDLPFLQLIFAAFKTSALLGKEMSFRGGPPEAYLSAARDAGLADIAAGRQ